MKPIKITSKRAYFRCPHHKDTNPSLVVTLDGQHTGKWYCFSCGRAGQLNKKQLEKLMAKKPKRTTPLNIDWLQLVRDYEINFLREEMNHPWNLPHLIDVQLNIGWDGEAWTFPMRNADSQIIGIQRRFPDGFKCCVEGSKNGLFIPQIKFDQIIYITEGVSDLAYLLWTGLSGIGRMNCQMIDEVVEFFKFNYKFHTPCVIADNDKPGLKGGKQLAKKLDCQMIVPKDYKDVKDWITNEGKETVKEKLLC